MGQYLDMTGMLALEDCEVCPPGTYGDFFAMTVCKECPPGTFLEDEGQTSIDVLAQNGSFFFEQPPPPPAQDPSFRVFPSFVGKLSHSDFLFSNGVAIWLATPSYRGVTLDNATCPLLEKHSFYSAWT